MNLYGCVFEGKQENHIVRLFVGCITVECSFVETFLGHRLAVNFRSTGVSDTFFLCAELVSHRNIIAHITNTEKTINTGVNS